MPVSMVQALGIETFFMMQNQSEVLYNEDKILKIVNS